MRGFINHIKTNNTCTDPYLFGFNGMEKDNEVYGEGNSYTAEFWEYDPRLGRRWNIDPHSEKYAWQSPYVAFNNNPIFFEDPAGLEGEPNNDEENNGGQTPELRPDNSSTEVDLESSNTTHWEYKQKPAKIMGGENYLQEIINVFEYIKFTDKELPNTVKISEFVDYEKLSESPYFDYHYSQVTAYYISKKSKDSPTVIIQGKSTRLDTGSNVLIINKSSYSIKYERETGIIRYRYTPKDRMGRRGVITLVVSSVSGENYSGYTNTGIQVNFDISSDSQWALFKEWNKLLHGAYVLGEYNDYNVK